MSAPGDNTAIIIDFRPCDSTDASDEKVAACRAYAARQGRVVVEELTVPLCPNWAPPSKHTEHRTASEVLTERLREPDFADGRCWVLLTSIGVLDLPEMPVGLIELLVRAGARMIRIGDDETFEPFATVANARFSWNDGLGVAPLPRRALLSDDEDDGDFLMARRMTRHRRSASPSRAAAPPPASADRTSDLYPDDDEVVGEAGTYYDDVWTGRAVNAASAMSDPVPGYQSTVAERSGPLPHSGLFIRRNNAFGTRSTLGIAELIDQGVLIDQTHIRFDDFIASNTDHIPAPGPDAAVAVSHGTAPVTGALKTHPETTHLVEIALRAGAQSPAGQKTGETLPVNFVFAVDVSASMWGEKLDQVVVAIRELHARLRDDDVLGIIVFNDQARTLLRATRKADLAPDELGRLIAAMSASGGTDLNLGLAFALNEIERFSSPKTVNCVYLFSDGDPTSGETDWVKIRANVAARLRGTVTLSCFGFGSDARIPELRALAGISGGHWTFVTQPEEVTLTLAEDLTRRESLAAINIQLRIDIPEETTVWHLYGHDLITDPAGRTAVLAEADAARRRSLKEFGVDNKPDLIRDDEGIRIFAPDLAYGETYWVVLELQASGSAFGSATVQYLDTRVGDNVSHALDLSAPGAIPVETVLTHGVGLWTSEVTFYALDDLYENDRESAEKRLNQHVMALTAAYDEVPSPQFRDDRVTLVKLVSLAGNLGLRRAWADQPTGGPFGYAVHTMNQFGRVRGGYLTLRGQ